MYVAAAVGLLSVVDEDGNAGRVHDECRWPARGLLRRARQLGCSSVRALFAPLTRARPAPQTLVALLPPLALALTAAIWGVTFTVADGAVALLPPADLVLWRFGLGAVVLASLTHSRAPLSTALRRRGVLLGGLLGGGFLLQTWGLTYTDALSSGFLTSLLVVIAPIAGWLGFGERVSRATWTGVALATCGVLALSLHEARVGPGELITLAAAALWGMHVVLLSRWSVAGRTLQLARCQTVTVAAMALLAVVVRAGATGDSPIPVLPPTGQAWLSVLFLGVLATAAAMALLSWSQSRIGAARAAVILTLEPAVAGLTAVLTGATLTGRVVLGASLLIGAIYVVELGGGWAVLGGRRRLIGVRASAVAGSAQPPWVADRG